MKYCGSSESIGLGASHDARPCCSAKFAVTASPNPATGLYMSWNANNESPLLDNFIAMLDFAK